MTEKLIAETERSAVGQEARKREIIVFDINLALQKKVHVPERHVSGHFVSKLMGLGGEPKARVLRRLEAGNFEDLRPEETTDVNGKAAVEFYVGRADRLYTFEADKLRFDWLVKEATAEKQIRIIGKDPSKTALFRILDCGEEIELDLLEVVSFEGECVEQFRTRPAPHLVEVCINGDRVVKVPRGVYTAVQLIDILDIPEWHVVNIILPNGDFDELEPGEKIAIVRKTDVVSHLPTGGAS